MPRDPFWATLHKQQIEQMLRIADEAEDWVYDELVPAIFPLDGPEERLAFFNGDPANGIPPVNFEALAQNNPKLYARYSKDALSLQKKDNASKLDALGQLRSEQEKQWGTLTRQLMPQEVLGMPPWRAAKMGLNKTPGQQGFGMDTAAPMGRFASGGSQ